ncbi:hypothetical protein LTS10_012195 [Elasticomyces elasticus]|nr:hypothetical protein LTS10_012195 [Elasticomyces elasticus]
MPAGKDIRFVVVSNPDQLRNRAELRLNRQHVMHNYLAKEASKPTSTDARVNGQRNEGRQKRATSPSTATDSSTTDTSISSSASSGLSRTRADKNSQSHAGYRFATFRAENGSSSSETSGDSRPKGRKARTVKSRIGLGSTGGSLVAGISGGFRNYTYLGTKAEEVPFTPDRLGGGLDPFGCWPAFDETSLRVNELKWSCSRRFGSRGIADYWVPALLSARHAFLSTIAISSAHDDIMRRSARPPDERPKHESVQRARVRQEVTSMINQSMSDPQMQMSDATMVAVLHLLNAEMMGCDDDIMRTHQQGLSAMVTSRGGLSMLGVNGQLAGVTTITMYIIAILRETRPGQPFIEYAGNSKRETSWKDSRPFPESPILCRPSGYRTIQKACAPDGPTPQLLELTRQLTTVFVEGSARHEHASSDPLSEQLRETEVRLFAVAASIFGSTAAEDLEFANMSDRYTYEAIRLTSQLFAHALISRVPFSQAAQQLQATGLYRSLQPGPLSTDAPYMEGCAMHIHIRNALMRTDTADCWGHMAGALFWVALVAGAAANPEVAPGGYVHRRESGEDEEARKFVAAIVVRCSIVLGFEFGSAVMETVKSMSGIQQALARVSGSDVVAEG